MNNLNFEQQLEKFVAHVDQIAKNDWDNRGYTHAKPPTHRADYLSKKWVRIVVIEHPFNKPEEMRSVYGFISREDGETNKTLGKVKAGDIHKAASFKAPAKHARGSIFDESTWNCADAYGIVYLRG